MAYSRGYYEATWFIGDQSNPSVQPRVFTGYLINEYFMGWFLGLFVQGQNAQNFQGFESLILSDAENAKKRRQFPSNMAVGQKAQISL